MSEDCFFLNPLRRDGASQRQRLVAALAPSSVAIDERELSDLLLYLRRYARLLRYYSPDGSPGGDWSEFLDHDPTTLVAEVAEADPQDFREDFREAMGAAGDAADDGERQAALAALWPPIFGLAETLDGWYRRSTEGLSLRQSLERLLGSVLAEAAAGALAAALRAEDLGLPVTVADTGDWSDLWGLAGVEADPSFLPSGVPLDEEEAAAAASRLERHFGRLLEALAFLVGEAPAYLAETLTAYAAHPPHMALLLAFLELLAHARDHLNTLTEAHLDFYYRRVLGLEPKAAVPDRVHVLFELAKSFQSHVLASDTLLKAGKDATGVELLYGTDDQLVINPAKLDATHGLKTIFVKKTGGVVENVYAAPDADSADGEGAAIEDEEGKWLTFGSDAEQRSGKALMPYAEIGFAVASPMFLLAEGTRTITLKFRLTEESDPLAGDSREVAESALRNVEIYASGEKEWLEVAVASAEAVAGAAPALSFELRLDAGADPVVAYDDEVLGDGFAAEHPVLKLILDNEGQSDDSPPEPAYPYKYFQGIEVETLEITVAVEGMRDLILENDVGILNPAKPFLPFGPVPKQGSSFLVGSPEVFLKPVTELDLAIAWADLPGVSFKSHYQDYKQTNPTPPPNRVAIVPDNDHFQATFSVLRQGEWQEDTLLSLFDDLHPSPPAGDRNVALEFSTALPRGAGEESFERFVPTLRRGFLRVTLKQSFLHGLYPRLLAQAAGSSAVPDQPYTPLMASLTLGYEATATVDYTALDADDFDRRIEQIFQVGPFGHREVFPIADDADDEAASGVPIARRLVPEFNVTVEDGGTSSVETAEGTLLIGLDGLAPPQNLSLLFQVAEGSEDPQATAQEVVWSYLADDEWVDFKTAEVLSDSTGGLLASGIVRFAAPRAMSAAKTVLPPGPPAGGQTKHLHWLKASVAEDSEAVPKMIAVHPQAVVASFRDRAATGQGNDPSHLETPLAAETISKLKSRAAAVKSVTQPYASFGGSPEQSGEAFYVRVSERLRHKGRAITVFDYERLVLEQFPEVYKVRCLNHTRTGCEHAPGRVKLVVVPNLRNKNAVNPLEPRLSLARLESIRAYLQELASDFVTLEVKNPDYEKVQVEFNVRFHAGYDQGYYTGQLEEDIIGFLSPWLQDDAADLTLGGRVHRSAILDFVEDRDYVDFVTDFKMFHRVEGRPPAEVEEAEATTSSAALVSDDGHDIGHDIVSCEDAKA